MKWLRIEPRWTAARLALGAAVLAAGCQAPGPPAVDPIAGARNHARTIIEAYMEATAVPALQIAVAMEDGIVWSEAFGTADLASRRPATTESRFRIASVSKLLTGTLTARLAARGNLELDRPLGEYVPDLPAAWSEITARMLVHHTSGIPHYADAADALDGTFYPTTRSAIGKFRDRPLAHPPGEGETYSSYAYTVLALAIEEATGRPFLEVMEREILRPLGMTHTSPDLRSSPPPERTAFYVLAAGDEVQVAPELDFSGRWAGSGYLSTAEDLARFGLAHTRAGHFAPETLALVGERQELPDGSLTQEGFGWGPRQDWDGRFMLWGDGSTPGARGGLLVYPEDGLVLAILTNLRGLALERGELQTLARLFLAAREGKSPGAPPDRAVGSWTGTMMAGETALDVRLDLESPRAGNPGRVSFTGWRSFTIADAFQVDGTTWLAPVDGKGLFPLELVLDGEVMKVDAPRAGLSFELTRATDLPGGAPADGR